MSKLRITTAIAALVFASSAPLAMAQTTLGGNAKDNTASGGMENGKATDSGKGMPMKGQGSMMKSGASPSTTTENKPTATGGQPGGDATRGK